MELLTVEVPLKVRSGQADPFRIIPIGDIQWNGRPAAVALDLLKRTIDVGMKQGAWFIGMGDYIDFACVELDAEILTREGWRHHDQVSPGDLVAAYDGRKIVWTPLLGIHQYDSAPVVEMRSKSFQVRVTPNHTWWTRQRGLLPTEAVVGHAYNIVVSAQAEGGSHPLTPDEAWLLGWLITDGHIRWETTDNFSIIQSKPKYVEELRARLTGMIRREGLSNGVHYFDLHVEATRAIFWRAEIDYKTLDGITRLPFLLSQPSREAMLDAMLKAEGSFHASEGRRGNWRFSQSATMNPVICEVFQNLCVMEGHRLGISKPKSNGVWTPRILTHEQPTTYDITTTSLGLRPVWCPETAFGTWVMRQGQQITITGNSPSNRRKIVAAGLHDTASDAIGQKGLDLTQEIYDVALKPTKGRWLGLLAGHHFTRLEEGDTTDMRLCQMLKAPFLGDCAFVRLNFLHGPSRYPIVIWCHHGHGGGQKTYAPVMKLENSVLPYWEGADIFLIGHMSKMATSPINRMSPRWNPGRATEPDLVYRKIVLVGTGGYSRAYVERAKVGRVPQGGYAEKQMLGPVVLGSPTVHVIPAFKRRPETNAQLWAPEITAEI